MIGDLLFIFYMMALAMLYSLPGLLAYAIIKKLKLDKKITKKLGTLKNKHAILKFFID